MSILEVNGAGHSPKHYELSMRQRTLRPDLETVLHVSAAVSRVCFVSDRVGFLALSVLTHRQKSAIRPGSWSPTLPASKHPPRSSTGYLQDSFLVYDHVLSLTEQEQINDYLIPVVLRAPLCACGAPPPVRQRSRQAQPLPHRERGGTISGHTQHNWDYDCVQAFERPC